LAVTGDVVRDEDSLDVALWFLAAEAGHDRSSASPAGSAQKVTPDDPG
jgi:hypothetical protein